MIPELLVFVLTYVLVAARRLSALPVGRPAGALAGAAAMVALSAAWPGRGLTPEEAFAAVEPNTIGLLLGMMLLAAALAEAGFFDGAAAWVLGRVRSPEGLLWATTLGAGLVSALIVNDPACLLLAPIVDRVARRAGLRRAPYLLALAMGSNAGSALTLAGNPQNMLVAHLSGLSYRGYLLLAGPAALVSLLATAAVLHVVFRRTLRAHGAAGAGLGEAAVAVAKKGDRRDLRVGLACLGLVVVAFISGANLAFSAIGGSALSLLLLRRDAEPLFGRVAWTVLVFFGALFIVAAGLEKTGLPARLIADAAPVLPEGEIGGVLALSATLLAGCQIVSNVPFILLVEPFVRTLPDPALAWATTALVSTLAGNLTLLGSVANIIVIETAGAGDEIGFFAYAKVGLPVTLVSTSIGLAVLLATHRLVGP